MRYHIQNLITFFLYFAILQHNLNKSHKIQYILLTPFQRRINVTKILFELLN